MNVTEFKTRYITFNDIEDDIVESELLLNESLLNPRLWINEIQRTTAQGLLTAHFLELERMENLCPNIRKDITLRLTHPTLLLQ